MLVFQTRGRRPLFDTGACRFWDGDGGGASGGGDGGSGGGATPPANPPANPPATPPASGDDALGEAGKKALQAERDARAAEKKRADDLARRLEEIEAASATDAEKAIKAARDEATKAERGRLEGTIRRSEARSALRVAGITNDKDLELAINAPEFASLAVDDDGTVKDLAGAVEQFRKDHPSLFAPAKPADGKVTRGPSGGPGPDDRPKTLGSAIAAHYAK